MPAGLCRAGHGRRIHAQQQQRYARPFGSQREPAAGGEIQLAHRAPAFHDHRTQRSAAQGIDSGAQQRHGIGHHAHQPMPRRTAQFGPTGGLHHATCSRSPLRPQPQHRPARIGHAVRQRHSKSRGGCAILRLCRIDFMDTPPRQPTPQRSIERGDAECPPRRSHRHRVFAHLDGGDSHMFLLCSYPRRDQAIFAACPCLAELSGSRNSKRRTNIVRTSSGKSSALPRSVTDQAERGPGAGMRPGGDVLIGARVQPHFAHRLLQRA